MKRKILKILAFILAVGLIIAVLVISNAMNGNPVSKFMAKRASMDYVDEVIKPKFPDYADSIVQGDTFYSFKDGYYHTRYTSTISEDFYFNTMWNHGKIHDTSDNITNGWNTLIRLNDEFNLVIESIMGAETAYEFDMLGGDLISDTEGLKDFTLDMELDIHNPPVMSNMFVYIYDTEQTWERVADLLLECKSIMDAHDIPMGQYTCVVRMPKDPSGERTNYDSIGIYDFPAEMIEDREDLPQILEEFHKKWEEDFDK